jgi:[methyl-Co(III) methanol-specific corrinoid protein]:coenzyme M methyltransferase
MIHDPSIFLEVLRGRHPGRAAVVCPGGMMSMAITEVMDAGCAPWPEAHTDARTMLRLAVAMQEATGFDNLAMPFCMTVEAEAYGARIDMGTRTVQPRVVGRILQEDGHSCLSAGKGVGDMPVPDFESGRARVLIEALTYAADRGLDLPVVGNLVGPFSLLGMLADPLLVMRWTRRRPELLRDCLERITTDLCAFGRIEQRAGADVICIAEPTATGEILGGRLFREFVRPCLERLVETLHAAGVPVIIHICGDVAAIETELLEIPADAMSFDRPVDLVGLVAKRPPWEVMGNVDAFLLERGPADAIARSCRRLLEGGVRLLAPACGVVPNTPLSHLRAMRLAVDGRPPQ